MFGEAGQQRLTDARVVLIGLSGLGSHLAQQLACLGVRRYTLFDGETVGRSDLSRLVGVTSDDVGFLKARVAARLIRSIQPTADVRVVVAGPASGCLFCRGELDRREDANQAVKSGAPPAGTASHDAGAVARRGSGASVVTIDGVVASLAATEIACLISGLRPPFGMLAYRAHEGIVTRSGDPPARHCPYCSRWAAPLIPVEGEAP